MNIPGHVWEKWCMKSFASLLSQTCDMNCFEWRSYVKSRMGIEYQDRIVYKCLLLHFMLHTLFPLLFLSFSQLFSALVPMPVVLDMELEYPLLNLLWLKMHPTLIAENLYINMISFRVKSFFSHPTFFCSSKFCFFVFFTAIALLKKNCRREKIHLTSCLLLLLHEKTSHSRCHDFVSFKNKEHLQRHDCHYTKSTGRCRNEEKRHLTDVSSGGNINEMMEVKDETCIISTVKERGRERERDRQKKENRKRTSTGRSGPKD